MSAREPAGTGKHRNNTYQSTSCIAGVGDGVGGHDVQRAAELLHQLADEAHLEQVRAKEQHEQHEEVEELDEELDAAGACERGSGA